MSINPYEPPNRKLGPRASWPDRIRNFFIHRLSFAFVTSSLVGLFFSVVFREGPATATRDTATFRGLAVFTLFSLIAAVVSLVYCPASSLRCVVFVRIAGGFSFGSAFILIEPYANGLMRAHPEYDIRGSGVYFLGLLGTCIAISVFSQIILTSSVSRRTDVAAPPDGG